MTTTTYSPDRTALLIVDPYNDFMSEGGKYYENMRQTAEAVGFYGNTRRLILGIGFETARRARAEWANVILTGRNPERVQRAASELDALSTAAFDATDPAPLERFFRDLPTAIDHVMVTAGRPGELNDYAQPLERTGRCSPFPGCSPAAMRRRVPS